MCIAKMAYSKMPGAFFQEALRSRYCVSVWPEVLGSLNFERLLSVGRRRRVAGNPLKILDDEAETVKEVRDYDDYDD